MKRMNEEELRVNMMLEFDELSIENLITLASIDYTEFEKETIDKMYEVVEDILYRYGKEIDDQNPDFPNNPYMWGYRLEGIDFYIYYTGCAGHYWGNTIACEVNDYRRRHFPNPLIEKEEIEIENEPILITVDDDKLITE